MEGKRAPPVLLVNLIVIVFSLIAFGFAIAGERHSVATFRTDKATNHTYCVYGKDPSDVATNCGMVSFLVFLGIESTLLSTTCSGWLLRRRLAPGRNRVCAIIFLLFSCMTCVMANVCIVAGVESGNYWGKNFPHHSCESLRKGFFIAAAVFIIATMVLNLFYYMHFAKAMNDASSKVGMIDASSKVGMTGRV